MNMDFDDGIAIKWNLIQGGLEAAPQDVLFILDCCYAGAAVIRKGHRSVKELLAACGREADTPTGSDSFSAILAERMKWWPNPIDSHIMAIRINRKHPSIDCGKTHNATPCAS